MKSLVIIAISFMTPTACFARLKLTSFPAAVERGEMETVDDVGLFSSPLSDLAFSCDDSAVSLPPSSATAAFLPLAFWLSFHCEECATIISDFFSLFPAPDGDDDVKIPYLDCLVLDEL